MDCTLLEADEFEVECTIRDIPHTNPDAPARLAMAVQDANVGVPTKMHPKASRRPDLELEACRSKLEVLQQQITDLKLLSNLDLANLVPKIQSRLLHVEGRLARATSSNTYGASATKAYHICKQLQSVLSDYVNGHSRLDESIEAAKDIVIEDTNPTLLPGLLSTACLPPVNTTPRDEPGPSGVSVAQGSGTLEDLLEQVRADSLKKTREAEDHARVLDVVMSKFETMFDQLQTLNERQDELQAQLSANQPRFSRYPLSSEQRPPFPNLTFTVPGSSVSNAPYGNIRPTVPAHSANPHAIPVPPVSALPPPFNSAMPTSAPPGYQFSHQDMPPRPPQPGAYPPPARYTSDYRSLSRCGLSYDGSASSVPIDMFVFQLETVASSMNLPEGMLLIEMSSVLKGVALQWYWTCRRHNPSITWYELRRQFMERFQDRRSDFEIRRSIETRKQLPRETFVEFYHQVWNMTLQCKVPYTEEKLIEILMQNMRVGLQYQLTDRRFTSVNDLVASCTAWEDSWSRLRIDPESHFGPRKTVHELYEPEVSETLLPHPQPAYYPDSPIMEPQLAAMHNTAAGQTKPWATRGTPPTNYNAPRHNTSRELVCFNCDVKGHTFNDCPYAPLRWFCYKCGTKDTVCSKCPRCSENGQRGTWRTGNPGPPPVAAPSQWRQSPSSTEEAATNTDPEFRLLARRDAANRK